MEATDHIHRPSISLELGSFFTFDPRSGCTWGHTPRVCTFIISNPVTGRQTAPWNSPTVASFPQLKLTFGTLLFEGQYFSEDAPESCWAHPQVGVLLTAFSATDSLLHHMNCSLSLTPALQKWRFSLGFFALLKEGQENKYTKFDVLCVYVNALSVTIFHKGNCPSPSFKLSVDWLCIKCSATEKTNKA